MYVDIVNLNKSIIEIESFFFPGPATVGDAQRASNSELNELKNNNTIDCRYMHLYWVYIQKKLSAHGA